METNPLVTWNPRPGDSNHLESPDDSCNDYSSNNGFFSRAFAAFNQKMGRPSNSAGQRRFLPQFGRRHGNGRILPPTRSPGSIGQGRHSWWGHLGPVLEPTKLDGNYMQLPKVAPPTAPGEHKKMILTQTSKKLENSPAEWPSKSDMFFERFSGVCANAQNEAELRISKLVNLTSNVCEFSSPVGLTSSLDITQIAGWNNGNLRYLQLDLQIFCERLADEDDPIPGLPGPRSLRVVLKLPLDPADKTRIHPGCTRDILLNPPGLFVYLQAAALPQELGIINTRTGLFDLALYEREKRKIYHECLFYALKVVLFRDYVGDTVVHDTHTRL